MARTWGYTRRNRIPFATLDFVGRLAARRWSTRRAPAIPASDVQRILVVEFWNIGDVVLTLPFLAQLKVIFPRARTTFLGQRHAADILANSAHVDDVVCIDIPWTAERGKYAPSRLRDPSLRAAFRELRARNFDIAFESRMDPRAKFVLAFSGARRRVGYDHGGCNWLLTDVVPVRGLDRHRADDWARLLEPFGGGRIVATPSLVLTPSERAAARAALAAKGVAPGERLVAIHPGASSASKRWPLERFDAVVRDVVRTGRARALVIEDPHGYGASLSEIPGAIGVRCGLREVMGVLAEADAMVCNDSGPMHLAAALGTPTIAVFHAHAAREFAPLGDCHHALTSPAADPPQGSTVPDASALLGVEVAHVLDALARALDDTEARCAAGS